MKPKKKKKYSEEILSSLFSSTTFSLLKRDIFRTGQSSPEDKQMAVRETRFPSISPLVSHFSVIRSCRPFVSSQISGLSCRLAMGKTCSSASCSGRFRERRVSPVASFAFRGKLFRREKFKMSGGGVVVTLAVKYMSGLY